MKDSGVVLNRKRNVKNVKVNLNIQKLDKRPGSHVRHCKLYWP
jgi:hypothetical protein